MKGYICFKKIPLKWDLTLYSNKTLKLSNLVISIVMKKNFLYKYNKFRFSLIIAYEQLSFLTDVIIKFVFFFFVNYPLIKLGTNKSSAQAFREAIKRSHYSLPLL